MEEPQLPLRKVSSTEFCTFSLQDGCASTAQTAIDNNSFLQSGLEPFPARSALRSMLSNEEMDGGSEEAENETLQNQGEGGAFQGYSSEEQVSGIGKDVEVQHGVTDTTITEENLEIDQATGQSASSMTDIEAGLKITCGNQIDEANRRPNGVTLVGVPSSSELGAEPFPALTTLRNLASAVEPTNNTEQINGESRETEGADVENGELNSVLMVVGSDIGGESLVHHVERLEPQTGQLLHRKNTSRGPLNVNGVVLSQNVYLDGVGDLHHSNLDGVDHLRHQGLAEEGGGKVVAIRNKTLPDMDEVEAAVLGVGTSTAQNINKELENDGLNSVTISEFGFVDGNMSQDRSGTVAINESDGLDLGRDEFAPSASESSKLPKQVDIDQTIKDVGTASAYSAVATVTHWPAVAENSSQNGSEKPEIPNAVLESSNFISSKPEEEEHGVLKASMSTKEGLGAAMAAVKAVLPEGEL